MLHIGCHLSIAQGYAAMGETARSIGADTFAFFTRNPRGGSVRAIDAEDVGLLRATMETCGFAPLVAHAPYTYNPCSAKDRARSFALEAMREDLERMELLPGMFYNFHPGAHVGQGIEAGIELIAETLCRVMFEGQRTCVLLETMAGKGTEVGGRFEELAAIIDRVCSARPSLRNASASVSTPAMSTMRVTTSRATSTGCSGNSTASWGSSACALCTSTIRRIRVVRARTGTRGSARATWARRNSAEAWPFSSGLFGIPPFARCRSSWKRPTSFPDMLPR